MRRVSVMLLIVAFAAALADATGGAAPVSASNCRVTSVGLTPLTDLGTDRYQGYMGGLYGSGLNAPPAEHQALAMARSDEVQPLGPGGAPAPDGKIVMLSVGVSITSMEYEVFVDLVDGDVQVSPSVLTVDGAEAGQTADISADPDDPYWGRVDDRIRVAGGTVEQVQVIWLKNVFAQPTGPFPESAEALRDDLEATVRVVHDRFPNLKLLYFSSRTYGGYASSTANPEPYAYESAFSVRWVIEKQMGGDPALNADPAKGEVRAPVLLWGPYLWADGLKPRSDGLIWLCSDFLDNGTHPADGARQKVANMLLAFFKTDETSRPWFLADPSVTPFPSPTLRPTNTPQPAPPTNTPRPPGEPWSFRVQEIPSGDQMWVTTSNTQLQQQLESTGPNRTAWLCGGVLVDPGAEWGWRFDPNRMGMTGRPNQRQRTTIRQLAANPSVDGVRCIQLGQIVEQVPGLPPTPAPLDTPTPVPLHSPTPTPRPVDLLVNYLPLLIQGR